MGDFRVTKRGWLGLLSLGLLLSLLACRQVPDQAELAYKKDFKLTDLSVDALEPVAETADFVDPAYGTIIHQATSSRDGQGRMRHEYSRRQAFNADNSLLLAQDGSGHWFLYQTKSNKLLKKVPALAGDSEPIWHPTDPDKLYFTERGGGRSWWLLTVKTGKKELVYDFSADSPWPEASSYWTKGEGTSSADGRYLTLIASHYNATSQETQVYGLLMLDLLEKRVVGRLDAKDFPNPGALPDHVSTAPSGKYAVISWLAEDGGTRAYSADFKTSRQLTPGSEHSDLAIGPKGEDFLVYADYQTGYIRAIDVANGKSEDLHSLYPAEGEGYALHISGQAFDKPGWAVVSTYADYADYGETSPAPKERAEYRKVWLMELKPDGRRLNVAHIRADEKVVSEEEAYFLEPQATSSRDLTKIVFASNMGGQIESYTIDLPAWVLD